MRAGISYFMAEVRRLRDVVQALVDGRRALVLFDEIFKGTNVKDALEASRQVILAMTSTNASGFLISSHLIELAQELEQNTKLRFGFLDAAIEAGQPRYSHTIKAGVSDERFGLHILRQEGVLLLLELLGKADVSLPRGSVLD